MAVFNIDSSADAESHPTLMPIREGRESKSGLIMGRYSELCRKTAELENRVSALEAALSGDTAVQLHRQVRTEVRAEPERIIPKPQMQKPEPLSGGTAAQYGRFYPGEVVSLGCYKNEPVEWIVLRSDRSSTLLLSKCMLDHRPYTQNAETVPAWLNRVFFSNTFRSWEFRVLRPAKIDDAASSPAKEGEGSPLLFLLSAEEYNRYSKTAGVVSFIQTDYDKKLCNGEKTANPSTWWLRSNNSYSGSAPCVSKDNGIIYTGMLGYYKRGVRPAVFTDTAALINVLNKRTRL